MVSSLLDNIKQVDTPNSNVKQEDLTKVSAVTEAEYMYVSIPPFSISYH